MEDPVKREIHEIAARWDRAMVENSPEAIGEFMADDWIIVGPNGSVNDKVGFLASIDSGDLSHNVMETHQMEVRVYQGTAVTVAVGVSGGHFLGQSFLLRERVSCTFVRSGGTWQCVLTHLSLLSDEAA
jgi:ketosteroid isomerase-like protein